MVKLRHVVRCFVWAALVLPLVLSIPAEAEVPAVRPALAGQTVDVIEVEGNRRANAEEIRFNIKLEEGGPLELETVSEDIKKIYKMGFFDDIQVDASRVDGKLVVTYFVQEKPAVSRISFVGNDELDEEDLGEVMNLRTPSILNPSLVKANAEKIQSLYADKGFYLAEVDFEILPLPSGNDVEVRFLIREFSKVKVKKVIFVGNKAISDEELAERIFTREESILGFMTGAGEFKEEEFKRDLQRIAAFYSDSGYPEVRLSDPQVRLSSDRESMYVTITIDEGDLFTISGVTVAGDLIEDRALLEDLAEMKEGEKFRLSKLFSDVQNLREYYLNNGYAYVNVEAKRSKNDEDKTLAIVYDISKGRQVRFGRIRVAGNQKTAERIIRRELLIAEGEIFNGTRLEASKRRVQRLGFFEKVDITTQNNADDRYIDVQVEVSERPTGTFQVGAGFSSVESFIATLQVSQENFLGQGWSLTAQATISGLRQLFNVQFFDPHFLNSDWRFRFTIFNFEFLFNDFSRSSTGATVGAGYPLLPDGNLTLDVTYTIEDVGVTPGGRLGRQQRNIGSLFRGGLTSSIQAAIIWDTRDNRLFPSDGFVQQASVEFADDYIGSENEFTRLKARSRWYFPLFWSFVLKFNLELGLISNINAENAPVPIFERFFVGGPNSVRGFQRATLGPVREVAADAGDPTSPLTRFNVGGNKQFIFNVELEFPILTSVGIKGVLFADAGNAFDNDQDLSVRLDLFSDDVDFQDVLRTAVGFGFRWFSPIGPLRFEWGIPLAPLPEEDPLVFEFSIGNSF